MKKLICLMMFFFTGKVLAQAEETLNMTNNPFYYISTANNLILTSNSNVLINGFYQSETTVVIKPLASSINVIGIVPVDYSGQVNLTPRGGSGTVVRPRPPGTGTGGRVTTIKDSVLETKVVLQNNPVQDELSLLSSKNTIIGYCIYDIYGKIVLSEKISPTKNYTIQATNIISGHYLLEIDTDNGENTIIKFIKN